VASAKISHGREQFGFGDAARPFFAQLRAVLSQVRDKFAQQLGRRFE
jgi:hypothetical protein